MTKHSVSAAAVGSPRFTANAIHKDPFRALLARYTKFRAECPTDDEDKAVREEWSDELIALETELCDVMPTTKEGAIEVVECVSVLLRDGRTSAAQFFAPVLNASANIFGMDKEDLPIQTEADRLVRIGEKIKTISAARDRYITFSAQPKMDAPSKSIYFKSSEEICDFEIDHLREGIPYVSANSKAGAAIQMMELITRVFRLRDLIPSNLRNYQINIDYHATDRLIFSVLDFLLKEAGVSVNDLTGADLDNRHLNPWLTPEDRLKILNLQL